MREEEAAKRPQVTRNQRRKLAKMQNAEDPAGGNEASGSVKKGEPKKQPITEENPANKAKKKWKK